MKSQYYTVKNQKIIRKILQSCDFISMPEIITTTVSIIRFYNYTLKKHIFVLPWIRKKYT